MRVGSKAKDHKKRGSEHHSKHTGCNPLRFSGNNGHGRNGNPPNGGSPARKGMRQMLKRLDRELTAAA
jgi:hypothetical protein